MANNTDADVRIGADLSQLDKMLNQAKAKVQAFGKSVAMFGASMVAAGTAIVAPMLYGMKTFVDMGYEIASTARKTGMSFGEVQEASFGARVDMDTFTTGIKKMDAFLAKVADGAPEAADALLQMGLTLDDLQNASQYERFLKIADGLQNIGDAAQRAHRQVDIFGRGGMSFDLTGGSSGVGERAARTAGFRMSDEDVQTARQMRVLQDTLGTAIKSLWASLGASAVPTMRTFFELMITIIRYTKGWVDANRPLLKSVFFIADKLILAGTAIALLGAGITAAGTAIGFILPGLILFGKFLLVAIAVGLAVAAIYYLFREFPQITAYARQAFDRFWNSIADLRQTVLRIWDDIKVGWQGVSDAIEAGNWALAVEIAWLSLKIIWLETVQFLEQTWSDFVEKHDLQPIVDYVTSACEAISAVWDNMIGSLSAGWDAIASAVRAVADEIRTTVDRMSDLAGMAADLLPGQGSNSSGGFALNAAYAGMMAERDQVLGSMSPDEQQHVLDSVRLANSERIQTSEISGGGKNETDLDRMRRERNQLATGAWFDAQVAAVNRQMAAESGDAGNLNAIQGGAMGSFLGSALSGFGASPVQQLVNATERGNELLEEVITGIGDLPRDNDIAAV